MYYDKTSSLKCSKDQINQNQIISVKSLPKCPIDLIRPGIQPQKRNGIITDILLIGGNEERLCYNYNIE